LLPKSLSCLDLGAFRDQADEIIIYASKENLTCGYSPQVILILVQLVMLTYALLLDFGLRRFTSNMPVSGSCSAVISAMCHQPAIEDGNKAVLRPLMWRVSSEEMMFSQKAQVGVSIVKSSISSRE